MNPVMNLVDIFHKVDRMAPRCPEEAAQAAPRAKPVQRLTLKRLDG
jgi:hypothetical protein